MYKASQAVYSTPMNTNTQTNQTYNPQTASVLDLVNSLDRVAESQELNSEFGGLLMDAAEVIRQAYREAGWEMSEAQLGAGEES